MSPSAVEVEDALAEKLSKVTVENAPGTNAATNGDIADASDDEVDETGPAGAGGTVEHSLYFDPTFR